MTLESDQILQLGVYSSAEDRLTTVIKLSAHFNNQMWEINMHVRPHTEKPSTWQVRVAHCSPRVWGFFPLGSQQKGKLALWSIFLFTFARCHNGRVTK